ncbi:ERCC4-related helicase [Peribacillus deserti]|uniref:ERCC4-related helicase n=1 Tax=Peribacillus deserti TaxID=673318 RepID=A0ABS2QFJ1_9BACI|nr:DEAD/DEAH box helicase [Peribacillus deserti]MBM7691474.1 ERCC4-related helicase [Peribacillus deserti]
MNVKIDKKKIIEMCGTVSFKRGDAFYRANKVTLVKYNPHQCSATVTGVEEFHVTLDIEPNGNIRAACSCPSLASFQQKCQHVAAVLLSVNEYNRKGRIPILPKEGLTESKESSLTENLLSLFGETSKRPSGLQLHFDTRQMLDAEFLCEPVTMGNESKLFGIKIKIGPIHLIDIRNFLEQVKEGKPNLLSSSITFDPKLHCFQKETDDVIQELIQIVQDEKMAAENLPDDSAYQNSQNTLIIPPSSWARLLLVLAKAPLVKLTYDGREYDGIKVTKEQLPLEFDLAQTDGKECRLKIEGMNRLLVFHSYNSVLSEGKLVQLNSEDSKRLKDLKQMLKDAGTNQIPIHKDQLELFLEKVVPSLNRIGHVHISGFISGKVGKTPLTGKLYLDRVKNRLLAGLEFHYDSIVINPLEIREAPSGSFVLRDMEKEDSILQLMEDASFTKTDGGYFLHNEELEYQFLNHLVPKLEKLVQIYATTAVRNRIFRGNAAPKIRVGVKKERTNWLEFKFEMDGIHEKHIREILLALEEKRKYYRLRNGSLLSLETREFEEVHHFLQALPKKHEDLAGGLRLPLAKGIELLDSIEESKNLIEEKSLHEFLEHIRVPGSLEFKVPEIVEPILRDYQKLGYKWMKTLAHYGFGGILADDMGLGKTLQSITYILSVLPEIRKTKLPVLIVCPSSLTYNWLSEFIKFAPHVQTVVMDGNKTERNHLQESLKDIDVVVTSYPLIRRDIKWFEKQAFHSVFFDEAQSFKNPLTQTARAVKRITADYRFALTGTPVENSLEDLWSIFYVVFPGLFKGIKEYSNLPRKTIARRIRPFLLRRLKEEVLSELPEKKEYIESAELLPDQKKLYAAYLAKLRHDTLKHLDKDTLRKNRIKVLAGLTRLRQICCHPALFVDGYKGSSAKFEQLMEILKESKLSGRRVLIFSQFTKMLELIGRELAGQGRPFFYLDGQTPSAQRVEICSQFNAGERDLFLVSLKAGGTGLNLTGADTVILYDLWWNPAVDEQAADRAHRIGQTNVVEVIKLVASGTIEEKINQLQDKKRHLIEQIIDLKDNASASWLTEEDIKEILLL